MQDTEFLLTAVNDSVGPSEITFVLCSLLQWDALGLFFNYVFLDYSSRMLPLQVLFIRNWQHIYLFYFFFTLTVQLHQTRLYLTWPSHEECVYFLLNPRTIVRRLWKKNRICRRGEKWVNLHYKLLLCPWEKGGCHSGDISTWIILGWW